MDVWWAALSLVAGGLALTGTVLQLRVEKRELDEIYNLGRVREALAVEELQRLPRWRRGNRRRWARERALEALHDDERRAVELHDKRLDGWTCLILGAVLLLLMGAVQLVVHFVG